MIKNLIIILLTVVLLTSFSNTNSEKNKIISGQVQEINILKGRIESIEHQNDSLKYILSNNIIEYITFREKMMLSESAGIPTIVNHVTGAQGLFQFMPSAKKAIGIDPNMPVNQLSEFEQYILFGKWVNLLEINLRDYINRYEGTMLFDTIPVTKYGLIAVAHLGGVGGAKKMLGTGGLYNPDDGHTKLSDYLWRFSGIN